MENHGILSGGLANFALDHDKLPLSQLRKVCPNFMLMSQFVHGAIWGMRAFKLLCLAGAHKPLWTS